MIVKQEEKKMLTACKTLDTQENVVDSCDNFLDMFNKQLANMNADIDNYMQGVTHNTVHVAFFDKAKEYGGVMQTADVDYLEDLADRAYNNQGLPRERYDRLKRIVLFVREFCEVIWT